MSELSFPYRISGSGRTATEADAARHARDLIEMVLFTAPGERVNRPEFGAGLMELLFDTNSEAMETAADFLIRSAIQRHLSDILTIADLGIRRDEGRIEISLSYVLRDSGETVSSRFRREL